MMDAATRTVAERRADRHERMLAAGLDRLGTVGLLHTSIEEICRGAAVSIRNFYEDFTGLPALLVAVHRRITERTVRAASRAFADTDGVTLAERLRNNYAAAFGSVFADQRAVRIFAIEILGGGPVVQTYRLEWRDAFVDGFVAFAADEVAQGRAPDRDYRLTALAVFGAVNELGHAAALDPQRYPLDRIVDELARLTVTVVR